MLGPQHMGTLDPISRARFTLVLAAAIGAITPGCSCSGDLGHTSRDGAADARDGSSDGPGGSRDTGTPPPGDLVVFGPGAATDAPTHFMDPASGSATGRADVLYPLDGVLLPRNVFAPDVQWSTSAGTAGDLYRIRFTGAPTTLTAYVGHTGAGFRFDYVID